jgi:hypothetical protein
MKCAGYRSRVIPRPRNSRMRRRRPDRCESVVSCGGEPENGGHKAIVALSRNWKIKSPALEARGGKIGDLSEYAN